MMRVRVHFNLHTRRWSVVDPRTGRVLASAWYVELLDGACRVQEGARQTVLRRGQRTVHAYVVGELVWQGPSAPPRPAGMVRFTYNPHRSGTFHRASIDDPAPVYGAERMRFEPDGSAWFEASTPPT